MISWLAENLASLVLLLVVAAIIFFLVRSKLKKHKNGACGCGCEGCSGCAAHKKGGQI
ncbi:MAG: FeoB-associated Cys-rich membrane protein [Lachnospiraceae bacterium]|nr:FeoB-associated Cys-rich membrane protein [Lachnospiraceae bacterium]